MLSGSSRSLQEMQEVELARRDRDAVIIEEEATLLQALGTRTPKNRLSIRLGIALMTKQPRNLETWLAYHHRYCGIERFFLRVEDTPELRVLLEQAPWRELVHAVYVTGGVRDFFGQADRQAQHVSAVVPVARSSAVTHLLHIDDDELLYCPGGLEALHAALAAAPPTKLDMHMRNLEALFPSMEAADPFFEARVFRHRTTT